MAFDFDRLIDRRNTRSYKWDQREKLFGSSDVLPLWVADMDFLSPPAVREKLIERASLGIYGYSVPSQTYKEAIVEWFQNRHGWTFETNRITNVPSVVTSLSLSVELFSEPGSAVVLQSPVYHPFYDVIRNNGRTIAKNPLLIRDGKYVMDYAHLESLFQKGAKLLLLCNPHNPGGRVWSREELLKLGGLCLQYGVTVVSDEIHCDLMQPGSKHTPFASLSPELANITVTCLAATKTFNLPGLHTSYAVIINPELKRKFDSRIHALSLHMSSHFAEDAVEAAYRHGEQWLDEMLAYVNGNLEFAIRYLNEHLPEVKPMRPEGTYLLWIDCRGLGLDVNGLKELMYRKAKVAFNEGSMFGEEGAGWLRVNLACPRSIVEQALESFCRAAKQSG